MTLLLDPRFQRVWRTPDSIQFGVDEPALVLDHVTAQEEWLLAALANGVTREGLEVIATRIRAGRLAVERLLDRVAPVLTAPPARRLSRPLVVLDGAGPTAAELQRILRAEGADVRSGLSWSDPAVDRADVAVIVASYAVEPQRHARWLRRDIPHLPIVYSDGGVTVGPLVSPGRTPCLRCIDLHRTDADPAWPAMATQLHTRASPGETTVVAAAAAARAALEVLALTVSSPSPRPTDSASQPAELWPQAPYSRSARLAHGESTWVAHTWAPHQECGCFGPWPAD